MPAALPKKEKKKELQPSSLFYIHPCVCLWLGCLGSLESVHILNNIELQATKVALIAPLMWFFSTVNIKICD